jgi:hypothetical protein
MFGASIGLACEGVDYSVVRTRWATPARLILSVAVRRLLAEGEELELGALRWAVV